MCWIVSLTHCKIFSNLSRECVHTRVEPQSLLDHLLQVLHVLKVTKRRIACRITKYLSQFSNSFLLYTQLINNINPLKPELNPICYLLALLGAHNFLHVSKIRVKLLTLR